MSIFLVGFIVLGIVLLFLRGGRDDATAIKLPVITSSTAIFDEPEVKVSSFKKKNFHWVTKADRRQRRKMRRQAIAYNRRLQRLRDVA